MHIYLFTHCGIDQLEDVFGWKGGGGGLVGGDLGSPGAAHPVCVSHALIPQLRAVTTNESPAGA